MNPFGSTLTERRVALNVSQRLLATRLGVNPSTVSRWEASTDHVVLSPQQIDHLAQALHADEPDADAIARDVFLLSCAAGYLPPAVRDVLTIPVIALLAMTWHTLTDDRQGELEMLLGQWLDGTEEEFDE